MKNTDWGRLFARLFAVTIAFRALLLLVPTLTYVVQGGFSISQIGTEVTTFLVMAAIAVLAWWKSDKFCPKSGEGEDANASTIAMVFIACLAAYLFFQYADGLLSLWFKADRIDGNRYPRDVAQLVMNGLISVLCVFALFNLRRVSEWITR